MKKLTTNKINIFNALSSIREAVANDEALTEKVDALSSELANLASTIDNIRKINDCYDTFTGVEIIRKQREAREEVINELLPERNERTERKHTIPCNIVSSWVSFIAGSLEDGTVVELHDDRFMFAHEDGLVTVHARYYNYSCGSKIVIQML